MVEVMTYCPKCGEKNEEDAAFCKKCGASMSSGEKKPDKEWEECFGGPHYAPYIWGLILILIGIWILFEFVLSEIPGMPEWVYEFEIGWLFALIIGTAIIIAGIRSILKRD